MQYTWSLLLEGEEAVDLSAVEIVEIREETSIVKERERGRRKAPLALRTHFSLVEGPPERIGGTIAFFRHESGIVPRFLSSSSFSLPLTRLGGLVFHHSRMPYIRFWVK